MVEKEDPAVSLGSVPLFSSLSKSQLRTIARTGSERHYKPGESIVKDGDRGIGFFLIVDGQANIEKNGKTVANLGPRQFFGEMALFDDQPRTADVRASSATTCLVLSAWEFWGSVGREPEVLRILLKETVRRLRSGKPGLSE